jgi:hypothetical protein
VQVVPDVESARRAMRAAEAEDAFWSSRYAELVKAYPDQFVAVMKNGGGVAAADADLDHLIEQMKAQGLTVHHVWVRFMAATPIHLAL